jgi:short-subunit dehydrogenase
MVIDNKFRGKIEGHTSEFPMTTNKPQVIVITGASAGIGRATVQSFAHRGASIGLIARGLDGLKATAKEVEALGGKALILPCDVSDADGIEHAASEVEGTFGPIDIWINNAMLSVFSPVIEMTPEEFRRVTEVTYLGYVYGTLSALRRMLPRDRGVIIQVGSALAYRGIPLQSAYCAAKHAIKGFVDSLRSELIHDGSNVKVAMVQLPAINTPQFSWTKSRLPNKPQPMPPIFEPEIAAEAIVNVADHPRREMYVGMPAVKIIEANKFFPGILDHYLAAVGYDGQQTDQPVEPDRRDNLWEPVPGDHGAHGEFCNRARTFSPQVYVSKHRGIFALALGVATGCAFMAFKNKWR